MSIFRSLPFAAALLLPLSAHAQITTSQGALDALTPHPTARHAAPAAGHRSPAHHPRPPARTPTRKPSIGRPPAIPAGPPPPPVFTAPVLNVPLHPPPPPPPVPVVPGAVGSVTDVPGGMRIGFGAGSSDLNAATMQALHDFAARVKATPDGRAILSAAAAGNEDDPSTPRRLALSRGLAARAVLINDGIASTRIYVRMNPRAEAGSDHVDLQIESNDPAPAPPPSP